jgi:hypothetical protein
MILEYVSKKSRQLSWSSQFLSRWSRLRRVGSQLSALTGMAAGWAENGEQGKPFAKAAHFALLRDSLLPMSRPLFVIRASARQASRDRL